MDIVEKLERLNALFEALRGAKPRPEKQAAWFTASALLNLGGHPDELAARVRSKCEMIQSSIGRNHSPTGALRWIYAGLLLARDIPVERFVAARQSLRDTVRGTRTGAMHAGGARAALMLCLVSDQDTPTARFFDMKKALMPPWWRADPSITDSYAAAHAAKGDCPAQIMRERDRAEAVFKAHRIARRHRRDGAKLCALLKVDPNEALARFDAFNVARKDHKALRRHALREMFMTWAVQGLALEDGLAIAQLREQLPKSVNTMGAARSALAHLVYTVDRPGLQGAELAAMQAVIAAQTAVMVTTIAASTAATSSVTTS